MLWRTILTTPPTGTGKQVRRSWHTSTGQGGMVVTFVMGSGSDLAAYRDADYADKSHDGRSVSGKVTTLGGAAVS